MAPKSGRSAERGPLAPPRCRISGIKLKRLFRTTKTEQLDRLIEQAKNTDPDYSPGHFFGYFYVETSESTDLAALAKAHRSWPSVQAAYVDIPRPDPVVNAVNDPRFLNQGYLDPAPDGIDAEYAWGFTGGDGAGQRVIDLERRLDVESRRPQRARRRTAPWRLMHPSRGWRARNGASRWRAAN